MTKAAAAKSWTLNEWADGTQRSWPEPVGTTAPAWAPALTLNAWTAAGSPNTFEAVQAADVGQYRTTGPDSVFTVWTGAALVPELGDKGSVLFWGGGHADYAGNEVYRYDLATRTWSRINEPSTAGNADGWNGPYTNGILSDGTPNVPHTYHFLFARSGKLVTAVRQVSDAPSLTNAISVFDPVAETWDNLAVSGTVFIGDFGGGVYDASRDGFWLIDPDFLSWAFFDFATEAWTSYTSGASGYATGNQVYVPTKDAVLFFPSAGTPFGLDPATPSDPGNNEVTLTITGTAPTFSNGDGIAWSANLGAIVYYPSQGNEIYLLTPPAGDWKTGTWTWSQPSLTGTSGAHDGNGTYGKFVVAEYDDGTVLAMVAEDVNGDVAVVKLQAAA